MSKVLKICHLYPEVLNLYGDRGNILCMKKRLEWRGIDVDVHECKLGDKQDLSDYDLFFIGGGQDFEQEVLLEDLRSGKGDEIKKAVNDGKTFLCICGGYQMMGIEVCDPDHVEGDIERLPGLGLLPVSTTMSGEKVTRQVTSDYGSGYEIHMGETRPFGDAQPSPLLHLDDGREDGYLVNNTCMGTYVHGILDNAVFVDFLMQPFADKISNAGRPFDYQAFKEEQYNLLANHVRQHVDMEKLYQILTDD